jgi:predicted RNA-binding Zn ribbon-like protein
MLEQPASAGLVQEFANTLDIHAGTDALATPADLAGWLTDRGLLDSPGRFSDTSHAAYLALRAGIREELAAHAAPPDPTRIAAADQVLAEHPVLLTTGGALRQPPGPPTLHTPLVTLAIAWHELVTTGEAARLKSCAEHTCRETFWDATKNRSRRWCSMKSCGDRAKSRAYRQRRPTGD